VAEAITQIEANLQILSVTLVGAFAELRKATISFVMSVRMEQIGSHWTDFHEI
jgi:hypothetical protein